MELDKRISIILLKHQQILDQIFFAAREFVDGLQAKKTLIEKLQNKTSVENYASFWFNIKYCSENMKVLNIQWGSEFFLNTGNIPKPHFSRSNWTFWDHYVIRNLKTGLNVRCTTF